MRDDVELVAIADLDQDEANRVAAQYDIPHVFSDYRDLLALEELDTVDVCLPNFLHMPVTVAALEAGKHVFCEKPMARTGAEAQTMYDAGQKSGKQLHVQMGTVFSKESRTAKYLIDEGALGRVYYAKASNGRRRGRVFVDGYATPHFVQKERAGGGSMLDMAVYSMARLVYLLGNPALEAVSGATYQEMDMDPKRREESGFDVEEFGHGFVRFEGDVTMYVEDAWAAFGEFHGDKLLGSEGGLSLRPFKYYTDVHGMDADVTLNIDSYENRMRSLGYMGRGYGGSQEHFVYSVLGRVESIDTAALGLKVAQITQALYDSAESGHEVRF
jgi:predicted dehydrogenase